MSSVSDDFLVSLLSLSSLSRLLFSHSTVVRSRALPSLCVEVSHFLVHLNLGFHRLISCTPSS
jgi:hypothetical protein